MDVQTDHYAVLGLPSGEEGAKLSEKEITKAYKKRALELHPDKRPNDRDEAHADIQLLNASHAVLKDEKKRKVFDDSSCRPKVEKQQSHSKRQKTFDAEAKARQEEEDDRTWRKFKEEVATIRAECAARNQAAWTGKVGSPTGNSRSRTKAKDSISKSQEPEIPRAAARFGTDHKLYEAYVLDKLKKAGEKQKLSKAGS